MLLQQIWDLTNSLLGILNSPTAKRPDEQTPVDSAYYFQSYGRPWLSEVKKLRVEFFGQEAPPRPEWAESPGNPFNRNVRFGGHPYFPYGSGN